MTKAGTGYDQALRWNGTVPLKCTTFTNIVYYCDDQVNCVGRDCALTVSDNLYANVALPRSGSIKIGKVDPAVLSKFDLTLYNWN